MLNVLPVKTAKLAVEEQPSEITDAPAAATPSNGAPNVSGNLKDKVNILLVDDRQDKLLALEAVLGSLEQNLVKARSGKEALRLLLQDEFAVILMDVSMPTMDGFETAAMIRKRPATEHTPIIFVTSIGNSPTQMYQGYSLGAVDYILTPIVPEVLRAKVHVFVDLWKKTEQIKREAEHLKNAEEKIRHLNAELEKRILALTDVNRELEAFNYSISHDLRAPLRSMSGFAQALIEIEREHLTPKGMDYAQRIMRSAKYMDALLRDLLAYSRVAREEIPPATIQLDSALNEVLTVREGDIRDRKAQVEIRSPLGTVFAHMPTVQQIFANLIDNGLKFVSPDRPPHLKIWTEKIPSKVESRASKAENGSALDLRPSTFDQPFVRVWVEDNGIGIAPEHYEKIFGLFERLHANQTFPGTGIGLAIVRKAAERMGGRVGLESRPGQGTRFWVDLPTIAASNGN